MTPDVTILLAASRSDHPHHKIASAWLESAIAACSTGATLRLMPMVVTSFLRLVTNRKIFIHPTPINIAIEFLDALFAVHGVEIPTLGSEWPIIRQLCMDKKLAGNDMPDAWLAATVIELGEHLVTFDRDFKKLLTGSQLTVLASGR